MSTSANQPPTGHQGLNAQQERFFSAHGLSELLLRPPRRVVHPYTWVGHLPFAQALVRLMRPRTIVELGTHTGNSFCTFCQAVAENGLDTRCYAVDTWGGDAQAGYYGETVYEELAPYVQAAYGGFASLLRMTFDEALSRFEDGSVDLLHIDGLHTYEAVRHDFDTWKSKLSSRGVVLFHDTQVFDRDFGVHRVWAELRQEYPGFEFLHSHGLGVLLVGSEVAPDVAELIGLAAGAPGPIQSIFESASRVWLPDEAAAYQRRFGSVPALSAGGERLDCELYIDCGNGFSDNEKLISCLRLENGKGTVRYELGRFEGLVALRFDPGSEAIALRQLSARGRRSGGDWQELEVIRNAAISGGPDVLLFAADPWVEFAIPDEGLDSIEIEIEVQATGAALVEILANGVRRTAGLEAQLKAHEAAAVKLWADLAEKDREIARLSTIAGNVPELQSRLTAQETAAMTLRADLEEKELDIARLMEETGKLAGLEAQLRAHEDAARKLWGDLEEKDRVIARLSARLGEDTGRFATLEAQLSEHEMEAERLRGSLAEDEQALAEAVARLRQVRGNPLYRLLSRLRLMPPLN